MDKDALFICQTLHLASKLAAKLVVLRRVERRAAHLEILQKAQRAKKCIKQPANMASAMRANKPIHTIT